MLRFCFLSLLLTGFFVAAHSQTKIQWGEDVEVTLDSFKDTPPNLEENAAQEFSLYTTYEFAYQMTAAQFAFTKNFNRYVEAYYVPEFSWMEEGELTAELLAMCNLNFDVSELFARKFRKELYERKRFGSSADFFTEANSYISHEYSKFTAELNSRLSVAPDWNVVINEYSQKVNDEIQALNEYCKSCKISKKKK